MLLNSVNKGARRGPARHPRLAIWIPEDTINETPSPEDDRVHHGRVQQERSDRSRAARRLQGLRQGLAQRTSNQDAFFQLVASESKSTASTQVIGKWKQECRKVQYCRHFSITFRFQIRLELSEPA